MDYSRRSSEIAEISTCAVLFSFGFGKASESTLGKKQHRRFPSSISCLEFIYSNTEVELSAEDVDELRALNSWNLERRYPDYLSKISKQATEKYTAAKYENVKRIRKCLLENL